MPTARYTAAGGAYRVGGHHFEPGDEHEVDAELATHLADVDDFEVIDGEGDVREEDGPPDDTVPVKDAINQGVCPWCDDYEGDNVGQHASAAHPDKWDTYTEG